jgi:mannose-6-phosphate isomerase-like protein (cupin superfamily)
MRLSFLIVILALFCCSAFSSETKKNTEAIVIPQNEVKEFSMLGNSILGLATKNKGSSQFEVWRSSLPPGSFTPPNHVHTSDEVFIFLKGKGKAIVGGKEKEFKAPCTVILPANIPHYYVNTGDEPTDAIVIIGADSKIYDKDKKLMKLPWRE